MKGGTQNCATLDVPTRIDCGSLKESVSVLVSGTVVSCSFLTISICAQDVSSQVSYSLTLYSNSYSISAEYEYSNYSRSPAMSVCLGGVAIIFLMAYLSVSLLTSKLVT